MTTDYRISLRSRLLAVVAALALVLLGVTIVTSVAASSLSDAVDQRTKVIYPATAALAEVTPSVIDLETGERGYVITAEPSFLEPYQRGLGDVTAGFATLRTYAADLPGLSDGIDATVADLDTWRTESAEPEIAAIQAGRQLQGLAMVKTGAGKAHFDAVRADLDGLQRTLLDASQANARRAKGDQQALRNTLIAGLVSIVALIVALGLLLTRWVTRPTAGLVARVGVVAGGDFRQAVDVDGPPEFAEIGAAVDTMRQRILTELDELERFNEALDQTGPVIQLLRAELEAGAFSAPDGVEVAGRVLAAEGLLAGDFYDLVPMVDGRFAVLVADVSGHGHEAGVLAIRFKFLVQAALQLSDDPSVSLAWAAERLGDTGDMFVTCALAVIDPAGRSLAFTSAGHSPGLMVMSSADDAVPLASTGPLIGPFPGEWRTERYAFGDATTTVALCSDGLLEARASADELFGFDRFAAIVGDAESVDQIVDRCCAAARDHAGERLSDDLTIVAVRILAPDAPALNDSAALPPPPDPEPATTATEPPMTDA